MRCLSDFELYSRWVPLVNHMRLLKLYDIKGYDEV